MIILGGRLREVVFRAGLIYLCKASLNYLFCFGVVRKPSSVGLVRMRSTTASKDWQSASFLAMSLIVKTSAHLSLFA